MREVAYGHAMEYIPFPSAAAVLRSQSITKKPPSISAERIVKFYSFLCANQILTPPYSRMHLYGD